MISRANDARVASCPPESIDWKATETPPRAAEGVESGALLLFSGGSGGRKVRKGGFELEENDVQRGFLLEGFSGCHMLSPRSPKEL